MIVQCTNKWLQTKENIQIFKIYAMEYWKYSYLYKWLIIKINFDIMILFHIVFFSIPD